MWTESWIITQRKMSQSTDNKPNRLIFNCDTWEHTELAGSPDRKRDGPWAQVRGVARDTQAGSGVRQPVDLRPWNVKLAKAPVCDRSKSSTSDVFTREKTSSEVFSRFFLSVGSCCCRQVSHPSLLLLLLPPPPPSSLISRQFFRRNFFRSNSFILMLKYM